MKWHVVRDEWNGIIYVRDARNNDIAITCEHDHYGIGYHIEDEIVKSKFIAACPAMYDMLDDLRAFLVKSGTEEAKRKADEIKKLLKSFNDRYEVSEADVNG